MKMLNFLHGEKAMALLAVILFLLLVMFFQAAVLKYNENQSKLVIKNIKSEEALYKSDAGVQYAKYLVQQEDFNPLGLPDGGSHTYSSEDFSDWLRERGEDAVAVDYENVVIDMEYQCEGVGCTSVGLTTEETYDDVTETYVTETYTATIDTTLQTPNGTNTTRSIEVVFEKYWTVTVEENCPPDTASCAWWAVYEYDSMSVANWQEINSD